MWEVGQSGWADRVALCRANRPPLLDKGCGGLACERGMPWAIAHYRRQKEGREWAAPPSLAPRFFRSDLEENRFVAALDADVEPITRHAVMNARLVGNQRAAPVLGDEREDGIRRVRRLVCEVQPRIDLPQHAARINADDDVRRLRLAAGARHRSRLDCVEVEDAVLVGRGAAETLELRVRAPAIILGAGIAALRVGLPDFQHAVVDGRAAAVGHLTL